MLFTDYLYENSKEVWDKYLEHPFLIELGEGTLDKEKFRKYLIQDYLYLIEYAKVYAMACVKSRNMKELKKFHNGVAGSIETETANHIMYLKDFGENIENMDKLQILSCSKYFSDNKDDINLILNYMYILIFENIKNTSKKINYINAMEKVQKAKEKLLRSNNFDMTIDNMLIEIWREINEKN